MSVSAVQPGGERLGVLGGTFDPIHLGHLSVADHALTELDLDRIMFVPAARPPHKPDREITPFIHRAAMLDLAVKDRPEFVVSSMEESRSGPSYSIDTLKELRSRLGKTYSIFLLIGMDAFIEIDTWKDFSSIPELCDIVVIDRPLFSVELMSKVTSKFGPFEYSPEERCWISFDISGRIYYLPMEPVDISSTRIREMISKGVSIDSLVPVQIAGYIEERGLYV